MLNILCQIGALDNTNDELLDIDDDEDMRNHRYSNMPTSLLAGLNGIGKSNIVKKPDIKI